MNKLHVVRFEVIGDSGRYDEGEQEDGTDVKTTFAFYGLAMYHANVLEHGLVNALALARVMEAREQAEQLLRDPWEQRASGRRCSMCSTPRCASAPRSGTGAR
ncbi:hypothetical protein [Streptomyces sp. NPDC090112]|uniref:hypothetical protein n=1 Tax=Streptomyces sp. NPDC090112 TaxID=3365949 RepID=UPI00382E3FC9